MEPITLHHSYLTWVFPAFLLIFGLVAFLRAFYPKHFADYERLLVNNKYIAIYGKKERKLHLFTVVLYLMQCICLALLIYVGMKHFGIKKLFSERFMFLELTLLVTVILMLKLVIQQWVSSLFDLSDFSNDYIFIRIAYSSYAAIGAVLVLFIGVYSSLVSVTLLAVLFIILLIINALSWIEIIKNNLKEIKPYIFYFILYLCALEIAPYVFLIYGARLVITHQ